MKMILPEIHFRIWTSFASVVAEDLTGYCLEGQPHTKGPDLTLHKWLYVLQDTYPCSTRLLTKRFHPGLRADGAAPTCILRVYALLWFHGFPLKHPTFKVSWASWSKRPKEIDSWQATWKSSPRNRRCFLSSYSQDALKDLESHVLLKERAQTHRNLYCIWWKILLQLVLHNSHPTPCPILSNPGLSCSLMPEGWRCKLMSAMNPAADSNTATPAVCARAVSF